MKEQVWAFVDVLGLSVCMYVQGFCGVVGLEEKRSGE